MFSDSSYGQVLQAYAMQTIVKHLGYNAYLLTYQPDAIKGGWLFDYIRNHTKGINTKNQFRTLIFELFVFFI